MIIARDDRILIRTSGRFILASMIIFYVFERASCNFLRVTRRSIFLYRILFDQRKRNNDIKIRWLWSRNFILFFYFIANK